MTIREAKKHKEVIEWWLSNLDKGVLEVSGSNKHILLEHRPSFKIDKYYVQNDEYAEFRIALADGKTVQASRYLSHTETFVDIVDKELNHYAVTDLRIKPEEPKFKVGDWIVTPDGKVHQFKVFSGDKSSWNKSLDYENLETLSGIKYHIKNCDRSIIKEWEPKEDELCIFWNDTYIDTYVIGKFNRMDPIWKNKYQITEYVIRYDNVAPLEFIQTLKDKL